MKKIVALLLTFSAFVACKPEAHTASPAADNKSAASSPAPAPSGGDVLARVNGVDITDAEVSAALSKQLSKVQSQIFDIKRNGLQDMIEDKLLEAEAKKRGVTLEELLKTEVKDKITEPTETDLKNFYEFAKARFNNAPFEQVKPQLMAQVSATKERTVYNDFIKKLKEGSKVEILMQRPRIEVSADDDPSKGDVDAPIQIIEFSEFQCPFCKKARPTVEQILETYKGKVHYVFRDFPLSFHKNAPKASEAANCAGDQKKYWEYNHNLWENQKGLEIENLKQYAADLKLDTKKFNECLDSGKFKAEIDKDIKEGSESGVSGTPAYFINGIFVSGAQPFDRFKEIIDEELDRLGKK
ncbi:thioredoxin domain-containing protein [bacterium]|nr:thioredoxin domain-containing protein [bacterium]